MTIGADALAQYLAALAPEDPVLVRKMWFAGEDAPGPEFEVLRSEIHVSSDPMPEPPPLVRYKVTATRLNVRRTPNGEIVGYLNLNDVISCDSTLVKDASGTWVKIVLGAFSLKYASAMWLKQVS